MTQTIDFTNATEIADNLKMVQVGDKVYFEVDLSVTVGVSKQGKMMGIASTGGFLQLFTKSPRGKRVSLSLYLGEK